MKQRILHILSVCYVVFALIMGARGANSNFVQKSTDSAAEEKENDHPRSSMLETKTAEGRTPLSKQLASFKSECAIVWTASWCQSCTKMYPIIARLKKEGYTVYVLDYDKNKALGSRMGIKKLPTTIIWQGGKEKVRYVRTVSAETIKKTLKKNKIPDYEIW